MAVSSDPALHALVLECEAGRIVFLDGTRTMIVAGCRLEAGEALRIGPDGDLPLLPEDAGHVRAAWREAAAEWKEREESVPAAPPRAVLAPPIRESAVLPRGDPAWNVPLRRTWEGILVHHSATERGNVQEFDKDHRENRGWLMVGYDFIICNGNGGEDGLVQTTERWKQQIQGAHAGPGLKRYNDHWVGICLVGDFNAARPTRKQMQSLRSLVRWLQARCSIPDANVKGHRDVRDTECPGRRLPLSEVVGTSAAGVKAR